MKKPLRNAVKKIGYKAGGGKSGADKRKRKRRTDTANQYLSDIARRQGM